MRSAAIIALALLLSACEPPHYPQARGEARAAMFERCMTLAAAMPRQADDDVADVVDACSNQALYMTNYIR